MKMAEQYNIKLLPASLTPWKPQKPASKQIAVLMSGGVDSSVTAYLLKEKGWDVLGITMKIPVSCDTGRLGCCGADAAFVCNQIGIPHYFVDVTEPFEQLVIKPFRQAYAQGLTPNPCAECNAKLKFSLVWDFLRATFGIEYLASGHYAKLSKTEDAVRLGRAKDKAKDQSYFLYGIAAEKLAHLVLPLGELTKNQVRSTARELNLCVAEKAESMELCFAGGGDYRAVLPKNQAQQEGILTDMNGNKIGVHKGVTNYTLGQRRGVGFAAGEPLYVGKIDTATNTVALGTREQVSCRAVKAERLNVLMPRQAVAGNRIFGKIRSYGDPVPCRFVEVGQNDMTVEFDQPQFAPCPGQKLVLYDDSDYIIAGGTIVANPGQEK